MVRHCAFLLPPLLATACALACVDDVAVDVGVDAPNAARALIGAAACNAGEASSTVAILGDVTLGDGGTGTFVYCTGSLIAPDTVLVAAHCITETSAEAILVNTSADLTPLLDTADEATRVAIHDASVPVARAVANPSYDGGSHDHDTGLLFLARTIDDVVPAVVITEEERAAAAGGGAVGVAVGAPVAMVGYGFDEENIAGEKRCGQNTVDSEDGSHIFTVGSVQGCNGDSGGGLFVDVGGPHARTDRVAGVASFVSGSGCTDFTAYADVAADFPFLSAAMSDCTDRAWCEGDGELAGIIPPDFYDPPPPPSEGEGDAAEGEGDAAEGEGDGGGDGGGDGAPGCASVATSPGSPMSSLAWLAAALSACAWVPRLAGSRRRNSRRRRPPC